MTDPSSSAPLPSARWGARLGAFSVLLLLIAIALHRFGALGTPVALNVFAFALAGAALASLMGAYALIRIWISGHGGALQAGVAIVLGLAMLAWPIGYKIAFARLPLISDISTDTAAPPAYQALRNRLPGMNPAPYPGSSNAQAQQLAYPDLRTFVIERPVDEAFDFVEETVKKLRWSVVAHSAPSLRPLRAGYIEATERTMIVGFTDDIVVRVEGSVNRARVDVRSSSRYGRFDFGQNAARIRRFLVELQARVDAAGPGGVRRLRTTRSGAGLKPATPADRQKDRPQAERDRAPPSAQRARAQKEPQR